MAARNFCCLGPDLPVRLASVFVAAVCSFLLLLASPLPALTFAICHGSCWPLRHMKSRLSQTMCVPSPWNFRYSLSLSLYTCRLFHLSALKKKKKEIIWTTQFQHHESVLTHTTYRGWNIIILYEKNGSKMAHDGDPVNSKQCTTKLKKWCVSWTVSETYIWELINCISPWLWPVCLTLCWDQASVKLLCTEARNWTM